jgi:tetratricopeptide (TPR) repeat protein
MTERQSEQTLMLLLELEPDHFAPGQSTSPNESAMIALPTLDQRTEMFLKTIYGADSTITPQMRAAARERLLSGMAADLAQESAGEAFVPQDPDLQTPQSVSVNPGTTNALSLSVSHIWTGFVSSLQNLLSPSLEIFTMHGLRVAAMPLVALLVVSSAWTISSFNQGDYSDIESPLSNRSSNNGAPNESSASRGLTPNSRSNRAVREQNLDREIIAEEAALVAVHPTVAQKMVELAGLYRTDGRYDEAEALCKRALAIQQRGLPANDPAIGRTIKELALIYGAQGRTEEANELLKRINQR